MVWRRLAGHAPRTAITGLVHAQDMSSYRLEQALLFLTLASLSIRMTQE